MVIYFVNNKISEMSELIGYFPGILICFFLVVINSWELGRGGSLHINNFLGKGKYFIIVLF